MLFDEILATLRDNGKSGLAYQKTVERADQALTEDPERAVGYRLLGAFAERFLESTGRLPVTTVQTEEAYQDFVRTLTALQSAYAADDLAVRLRTLNEVATASRKPLGHIAPSGS